MSESLEPKFESSGLADTMHWLDEVRLEQAAGRTGKTALEITLQKLSVEMVSRNMLQPSDEPKYGTFEE